MSYEAIYIEDGSVMETFANLSDALDFVFEQRLPNDENVYAIRQDSVFVYGNIQLQRYIDNRLHENQMEQEAYHAAYRGYGNHSTWQTS